MVSRSNIIVTDVRVVLPPSHYFFQMESWLCPVSYNLNFSLSISTSSSITFLLFLEGADNTSDKIVGII
jgi:hypothetical protein